jgi:hypothetical protein
MVPLVIRRHTATSVSSKSDWCFGYAYTPLLFSKQYTKLTLTLNAPVDGTPSCFDRNLFGGAKRSETPTRLFMDMELKQRKAAASSVDSTDRNIDAAVEIAANYVPGNVANILKQCTPFFKGCSHFIQVITPLLMKVLELCQLLWKKLEPYHPEEFLPALAGLVVAFFG